MTRYRAAVTIRAVRSGGGTHLEFQAARKAVPPLRIALDDDGVLREARAELDRALVDLKDAIPDVEVTDVDAPAIYKKLRRIGLEQMFLIFSNGGVIQGLVDFWRSALPFAADPTLPPPQIECIGELGNILPIEYLPLFSLDSITVRDRSDLIRACRDLVGFSCIVRRSFLTLPIAQGSVLHRNSVGRLPLRFLFHDGLPGAKHELRWFLETAANDVDVIGPYPTGADSEPSLGEQIHDPRLSLDGAPGSTADGIQHFACHCYATSHKPLDNELELSNGGEALRITLKALISDISDHFGRNGRPAEMPLVVMNACGASRISAGGALGFPWFFLKNDNRGFIGSDVEVPDDVAAEFSTAFYTYLILDRKPLGVAFHGARTRLLTRYGNPLGISYSAYADPDLRVEPKLQEQT
jgi:hypothetical protein